MVRVVDLHLVERQLDGKWYPIYAWESKEKAEAYVKKNNVLEHEPLRIRGFPVTLE